MMDISIRNQLLERKKVIALLFSFFLISTCFSQHSHPYKDHNLSLHERVYSLIESLTIEEKISQLSHSSPAIPRLGIPEYNWWNEALHGVGRSGVATVFPQAIGLGATFDEDLIYRVAEAISDEARAMYYASIAQGYRKQYSGLTFWTPNINIFRDPRWGRGQETYGEDPFLTSVLGVAFVKGLQGTHPDYLKTAACAKHYAVHSGPERLRHEFDAITTPKDLNETYLPAFKALVEAGVEAVMCAYNRTNGDPCCAHNYLLQTILKEKWGFKGHVVTDCWAIADFYEENGHRISSNAAEASAQAIKSGVNLNCGDEFPALIDAVASGLISETEIDSALAPLLRTRFKLAQFDPVDSDPFASISSEVINSASHRELARETARKSMVLLKNNGALPLRDDLGKYFVTGPNAADIQVLLGNYYGVNPDMVTILEGVAGAVQPGSQVQYRQGILLDTANKNPQDWTTRNAKNSDATFVVLGLSGLLEGEEGESIASPFFGDRPDYNLPEHQIEFLRKLKKDNTNPVITIITGGSPMNLEEVHEISDAVILAWYPGQEGGNAVADILFGRVSPSGRLPITFPKSLDQLPPYEDYSMKGRTYRYMEAEPMYSFGFGLSYTKFEYKDIKISKEKIRDNEHFTVNFKITNTGNFTSDEVVQMYISHRDHQENDPYYTLKRIKKIILEPGESVDMQFEITAKDLLMVDEQGLSAVRKGKHKIYIGGSLPDTRSMELGSSECLSVSFTVR